MKLHRVVCAQDPLFAEAFALYEISFPEHEQRFLNTQTALMTNPLYRFDVIMKDDAFAGIILYWESSFYTYIEHYAIHPSMRGNSLGSRLLEMFCTDHPYVILEIDPPINEIAIRRESFYLRLGFQRNDYAHKHPAYRKQFPPHDLVVMSHPRRMTEDDYQLFRRELGEIVMKDSPA